MTRQPLSFHTLENGIRLMHHQTDAETAHLVWMVTAGSRNESPKQYGLAHLIEHMFFKGTAKRKAFHILSRMEHVGGELNAFTGKEETALYTSFLPDHFERAAELISDIISNSVFPEKEIKKEKEVIADEIRSYLDQPSDYIFDEFEEQVFQEHALGHNILGTFDSLGSLGRHDILSFFNAHYTNRNMVLASTGNISDQKIFRMLSSHFDSLPGTSAAPQEFKKDWHYRPSRQTISRSTTMAHGMMGAPAYSGNHPKRYAMLLLNNLLGGPGLNSRLNLNIREKYGNTYQLESHYQSYSDTGLFCIYFGTETGSFEKTGMRIENELKKLMEKPLGDLQLQRAKLQLKGQLALARENSLSELMAQCKSHLYHQKVLSLDEIFEIIENISAVDLLETALEIFRLDNLSYLSYIPLKQ